MWTILSLPIFIYPENNLRIFNNIWRFSTHKYKYILQSLNCIKLKVLKKTNLIRLFSLYKNSKGHTLYQTFIYLKVRSIRLFRCNGVWEITICRPNTQEHPLWLLHRLILPRCNPKNISFWSIRQVIRTISNGMEMLQGVKWWSYC